MKNKLLALGSALVLFAVSSCSDKEPEQVVPVEPGTEIQFGSTLEGSADILSRTYYGDPTELNGKTVWPIYWNPSSNADHIFIYSPEGIQGRQYANYTVVRNEEHPEQAANVEKDGAFGVQSGNATTYNFYGLYPASAVNGEPTGKTVSGHLPGAQTAFFTGTVQNRQATDEATVPDAAVGGGITYYMNPDMSACLMTAQEENITLTENTSVNMIFKPFATCLDITINGPETNSTTGETTARVTRVVVESDGAALSGDFSYDFEKGTITLGANTTKTVAISTLAADKAGNMVGIPLTSGNKLNLQAFILPNPDIKSSNLKVTVYTSDFKERTKTLTIRNLGAGQINPVQLPVINLNEGKVDYSVWLSQLDPRIYVSELSLPGSVFAFSTGQYAGTSGSRNLTNTQSLSIKEQFKAGIRVFQTHCFVANQQSTIDGGNTSICISVVGNPIQNPNDASRILTIGDLFQQLNEEMENDHSDEFCVLLISDYEWSSSAKSTWNTGGKTLLPNTDWKVFYDRMKTALNSPEMSKYVVTDFSKDTTIGDIKGKILVKFVPNYSNSSAVEEASQLNGTHALFNAWLSTTRNWAGSINFTGMDRAVFYSPLKWATTDGINTNNNTNSSNTPNPLLFIHTEQANPAEELTRLNNNSDDFWVSAVESQIKAYNNEYDSGSHNIFGLTFLGGNGYYYAYTVGSGHAERTTAQVAQHFNAIWTSTVDGANFNDNKPYGWVLFNCVGTEPTTNTAISKVINNNVKEGFLLNRDKSKSNTPKYAPQGNNEGMKPAGELF